MNVFVVVALTPGWCQEGSYCLLHPRAEDSEVQIKKSCANTAGPAGWSRWAIFGTHRAAAAASVCSPVVSPLPSPRLSVSCKETNSISDQQYKNKTGRAWQAKRPLELTTRIFLIRCLYHQYHQNWKLCLWWFSKWDGEINGAPVYGDWSVTDKLSTAYIPS